MSVFHLKDINTVWLAVGADVAGLDWQEFTRLLYDVSQPRWHGLTDEDKRDVRWLWEDNNWALASLIEGIETKLKQKNNHVNLTPEEKEQIKQRWTRQNWMLSDIIDNVEFKMKQKVPA